MDTIVTLTSDFICPCCLIDERRLQKIIRRLSADAGVTVMRRPSRMILPLIIQAASVFRRRSNREMRVFAKEGTLFCPIQAYCHKV